MYEPTSASGFHPISPAYRRTDTVDGVFLFGKNNLMVRVFHSD